MHILLAVDGSEGAREAARTVAAMPFPKDTRVTLMTVLTRYVPTSSHLPAALLKGLRADENSRAESALSEIRTLLSDRSLQVETRVVEGHPVERITETARDISADLIMLGALGLTGWMRMLLGSTSLAVVKHSPCPVWVVKRPFKHGTTDVLIATDGSAGSKNAIRFATRLPFPKETVAHLMHAVPAVTEQLHLTGSEVDPPVLTPLYEAGQHLKIRGEHIIKEDAEPLKKVFAEVRAFTVEGEARRQILDTAKEVEADLIILGSHGLSGIRQFFLGSIANRVLKHAEASVLITPMEP